MANDGKVEIKIETNADSAAKSLDRVSNAFDKSGNAAEEAATAYSDLQAKASKITNILRDMAAKGDTSSIGFKKLSQEAREVQKSLNQVDSAVNKAVGNQSSGMNSLVSMGTKLIGGYIGIQGAIKAFNFAMESVDAFRVQERAVASLNTTLKNAGVYTDEYSAHLQALASEIQSFSNYGDELVIKATAIGQSFMGQTRMTDDLVKATTDFAAAMGMDLDQAFTLVGKSIGSSTNALGRYGVELQKGMSDSQKMEAITKQLADRYTGSSKAMADSNVQLKNSVSDMKEAFGSILNGYVANWQSGMSKIVQSITGVINSVRVMNAELSNLNTAELNKRLILNSEKIASFESRRNPQLRTANEQNLKVQAKLKADNAAIIQQIKYIKSFSASENKKPIKMTDEIFTGGGASFGGGGGGRSRSGGGGGSSAAKVVKDDLEKLQEEARKTEQALKLALYKYGENSSQVEVARQKWEQTKTTLDNVQKSFENVTAESKSHVEGLNDDIRKTTEALQELYFTKGINSEEFLNAKNHLFSLQTEIKNMNTAISSNLGVDWKQVSDSIKSNLTNAILTPLQQGESAFDRLATIGLNAVQMVGQAIIKNLLEQITLEKTLQAIRSLSGGIGAALSFIGIGSGVAGGAAAQGGQVGFAFMPHANGNVFYHGNVVPFARGGIVNKPTIFPMANGGTGLMGEAGAEAVMPLRRMSNGRLGVEADNSGSGAVVNIYNYSGANVETRKRDDNSVDVFIRRVNEALSNERTSSGFRSAWGREDRKGLQAV